MIFICTAMHCEASPFIKHFRLKKDFESQKFQIYKSKEVILIITGIGKIESAIAVTYLLTKYEPTDADFLINVGICGTSDENIGIGTAFLCNKIIDHDTKRNVYPDMLFKHPFREASIETCSTAVNDEEAYIKGQLVDMEASAVYLSARVFLKMHQMLFIKIVSDHLKGLEQLNRDFISQLIEHEMEKILNWINILKIDNHITQEILSQKEQEILEDMQENLKLSKTMANQLEQLAIYYKLQHGDLKELLNRYLNVTCMSKKEGKNYFAELKHKLV